MSDFGFGAKRMPGQRLGRAVGQGFGFGGVGQPKRAMPRLGEIEVGRTDEGRPIMMNQDGSFSSQRLATIELDGGFVNVPTIYGGREVPLATAVQILRENGFVDPDTGLEVSRFATPEEAEKDARDRSFAINEALERALKASGLR